MQAQKNPNKKTSRVKSPTGAISPTHILSESRNYPDFVYWRIFYFMWLRRIYELSWSWKGRNYRDYGPSHLTFREYFRPFWFSRSCVVVVWRPRDITQIFNLKIFKPELSFNNLGPFNTTLREIGFGSCAHST